MKLLMFKIPVKSMIAVILAHVLGIIVGMYAATFVEKESFTPLYIVGGLLMLGSVLNLVAIPHPKWFAVTDILVSMIGIYGFLMFRKLTRKRASHYLSVVRIANTLIRSIQN